MAFVQPGQRRGSSNLSQIASKSYDFRRRSALRQVFVDFHWIYPIVALNNMKIQIHHIPSSGLDLEYEEKPERFDTVKALLDSGECDFITPVTIALQVTPLPDMIRAKGRIAATTRQACARCLEFFERRLESGFVLDYSKTITAELHRDGNESIELTAQQIGMIHYQGDEIDFSEAIQEQIILALPYRPICSDACKGLCARCGRNLNFEACDCRDLDKGGPFDLLKSLKLTSE